MVQVFEAVTRRTSGGESDSRRLLIVLAAVALPLGWVFLSTPLWTPLTEQPGVLATSLLGLLAVLVGVGILLASGIGLRLIIAGLDSWNGRSPLTVGPLHASFNTTSELLDPPTTDCATRSTSSPA